MIRNEMGGGGDLADTNGRDQLRLKHIVDLDEAIVGGPTCVRFTELVGGRLDVLLRHSHAKRGPRAPGRAGHIRAGAADGAMTFSSR
jgi:hypothetical protein